MPNGTCTIDGCVAKRLARGLCHTHYMRWHRTGSPLTVGRSGPKPGPPSTCSIDGCCKRVKANGLCGMHAQRVLRHGSTETPQRAAPPEVKTCRQCSQTLPCEGFPPGRRVCRPCTALRNQAWRAANRDALRSREEAYRRANQGVINLRARKRVGPRGFTQDKLDARIAFYGGICWICRSAPYEHLDHVKPIAAGGPNLLANVRPACAACNLSKGAQWPFVRPKETS
jgi:5-methylcytosine-specific restriction endonuclease McrA